MHNCCRFGHTGLCKVHMFGSSSIIVIKPEACRRVLTDDEAFKPGWPYSTVNVIGKNSFIGISDEDHMRLFKLTVAPVNGHESLSTYLRYIEDNVVTTLENGKHGTDRILN
ncbi:Ent-kaurenoic acid oxidase 1 [Abeliophyllum distichum]|uniref:Ent-kaurenoic acid oxidase 1 n=1 Tax=Abeliophyllum distichum TaxID=126358 RepID=A0ABD1VU34_9LAMI